MARVPQSLAIAARQRAGGRCEYCGLPEHTTDEPFEIEHVIARKHHGETALFNLALACMSCNRHKGSDAGGLVPGTGEYVRLFHPRVDAWEEHFRLLEDGTILGRTKHGIVTVDVLRMNLVHLVNRRRMLLETGEW
jgi:5-methylcytosine-specific restriction endonuclease McrA